jgi:chorismate-pyruvate lyase
MKLHPKRSRRWRLPIGLAALSLLLLRAFPVVAADRVTPWPDSPATRTEAEFRLKRLENLLLTQPSATAVLESWCKTYQIARDPRIVAERPPAPDKPAPPDVRTHLRVTSGETIHYRHVRLLCGGQVLSEADNWYVADRLTAEMNRLLGTTDTPFGRVISSLQFRRTTLSSQVFWSSRSAAPDSGGELVFPAHVITNEAVLHSVSGLPIAEVVESYTAGVLGSPPPR